jgi:alpha-glutamyl/putrescinyl thymine pyrophosphorylase clade 1
VSNKWDFLRLPLQPNDNLDVYWRWIVDRYRRFERRLAGEPLVAAPPGDKFLCTLAKYSFCNPFRVLDSGSQIVVLLQRLSPEPVEVFYRTALYRGFNSPETMTALIEYFGGNVPSWRDYDFAVSSEALGKVEARIGKLYRGAYMFNDSLVYGGDRNGEAYPRKYQGSLRLVQRLIEDGVVERVCAARTVEEIFNALNNRGKYFAFSGGFLAMQLAYDLAYSDVTPSGEDDFWPIRGGNGYADGMKLCFGRSFSLNNENDLRVMARILWRLWEEQDRCFATLGYPPIRLFGQRELKPIDLENSFCETSKMLKALNGIVQPRTLYKGKGGKLEKIVLPRKWGITPTCG